MYSYVRAVLYTYKYICASVTLLRHRLGRGDGRDSLVARAHNGEYSKHACRESRASLRGFTLQRQRYLNIDRWAVYYVHARESACRYTISNSHLSIDLSIYMHWQRGVAGVLVETRKRFDEVLFF